MPVPQGPQYGGFWIRLGAHLLDTLILAPFSLLVSFLQHFDRRMHYLLFLPSMAVGVFLYVYCVKRWGGSPGKLICGLRIVTTDFRPAGWREAWLRHSVNLLIGVFGVALTLRAVARISDAEYASLGYSQQNLRIVELGGVPFTVLIWALYLWIFSEFVVLLCNRQRRALHDYIAGTVVVRARAT